MNTRIALLGGLVSAVLVLAPRGPSVAALDPAVSCADLNADGALNLTDAVFLLEWLFRGGPEPTCAETPGVCGDVNADADADITDAVCILGWLEL